MSSSDFSFTIEPWVTTDEEVKYTTNIFKLLSRDMKIKSEDHKATFSIIEAPDWINVIPLTEENEIVLVEQYRYGIEEPTLELPGGMIDLGESPLETCKRELLEETGYAGDEFVDLGRVSSNPAMLTNYTYTYVIKNCKKVQEQKLDGNERINVHLMPLDDFLEMVNRGEVHHSLVVAAVAKFLLWRG
ncbi:MAG: NUDIX domain-containing protein [Balneola sp.]|jgi:8-oxo-dGTP pyrophosphatase MutT (NUDIX family)|nr:NUDIX domain-containing protein [Balneola sp.]MBE80019.1 NUDIX domain-containing protein [Balneola sp.]HBX65579.1 NUDIX domain-containing protein [Balneolaceae bacterium]|tara:strand:- start:527 stop:1090 length:564 start_codon:yes stop_codon:yes gene_type:complete